MSRTHIVDSDFLSQTLLACEAGSQPATHLGGEPFSQSSQETFQEPVADHRGLQRIFKHAVLGPSVQAKSDEVWSDLGSPRKIQPSFDVREMGFTNQSLYGRLMVSIQGH